MLARLRNLFGQKPAPVRSDPVIEALMQRGNAFAEVIQSMLTLQLPWCGLDAKGSNWGADRPTVLAYILGTCAGAQEKGKLPDDSRMAIYLTVVLPMVAKSTDESEIEAIHDEIYYLTAGNDVPQAIMKSFYCGQADRRTGGYEGNGAGRPPAWSYWVDRN